MPAGYIDRQRFLVERMGEPADDCPLEPFYAGQWVERKRILDAISDFTEKYKATASNPLTEMMVQNYEAAAAMIVSLINDEVDEYLTHVIESLMKEKK